MEIKTIDWSDVLAVWRDSGRTEGTRLAYECWARRYVEFCARHGGRLAGRLTHVEVQRFVAKEIGATTTGTTAFAAVRALWCALRVLGHALPPWREPQARDAPAPLVSEFIAYRIKHGGVAAGTTLSDARTASAFLMFLRSRRRRVARIRVGDLDDFVTGLSHKWKSKTVARVCSTLRAFLSFLHVTGRLGTNLARVVVSPRIRRADRPSRALKWGDVRRILRAIDLTEGLGRRDFALFLLMATYGMGAGEVLGLRLDDIDWVARTVHVHRPKTGTDTVLPLLDPVARALACYLRGHRPARAGDRNVFVSHRMPHARLSASSAIRHRLIRYAAIAGVHADFLGTHVFRHTHATHQIENGVTAKIVGDILGHKRPESTSTYVRSAIRGLRAIALPVPV